MPLKNYTTVVPAMQSIQDIQGNLVKHGARSITIEFDEISNEPSGVMFRVLAHDKELDFYLPANIDKVQEILLKMRARQPQPYHSDYEKVMERVHKQAMMTAWKTVKDWIDAQMAFIETEMVTLHEIFLPYMLVRNGQTLYHAIEGNYLQIEGPRDGE